MQVKTTAALLTALAITASPANALELGISDPGATTEQVNQWSTSLGARWERLIVARGEAGVAERIRDAHANGRKVILTVGGTGTRTRGQDFPAALRYIATLPRADRYTIGNEPDLDTGNASACAYRRGWLKARRVLGRRLLWGDFSPHAPLTFTQTAAHCHSSLRWPKHLDVAIHPYQYGDPLAPGRDPSWTEGAIGNLRHGRAWLKHKTGTTVRWWITEFGYLTDRISDDRAAWLWPRAIRRAEQIGSPVLIVYTAKGATWDTRPGVESWAAIRAASDRAA